MFYVIEVRLDTKPSEKAELWNNNQINTEENRLYSGFDNMKVLWLFVGQQHTSSKHYA